MATAGTKRSYDAEDDLDDSNKKRLRSSSPPGDDDGSCCLLPNDILIHIFSSLSANSLWRLRQVCKPWQALIDDPAFMASHLRQAIRGNPATLLFHYTDTFFSAHCPNPPQAQALRLVCPFLSGHDADDDGHAAYILASCNGIFLAGAYLLDDGPLFSALYLWNPTTAECVKLPDTFANLPTSWRATRQVYGLGYDSSTQDYKVIRMAYYGRNEDGHIIEPDVHIYSLRSDSYKRRIQDVPYSILPQTRRTQLRTCFSDGIVRGLFHCGAIHWLGKTDPTTKNRVIVAFDAATEEFKELQLPLLLRDGDPRGLELGMTTNGCLGLYQLSFRNRTLGKDIQVYAMKEYGASESWVRTHTIPYMSPVCLPIYSSGRNCMLVQSSCNDFVLWDDGKEEEFRVIKQGSRCSH